MSLYNLMFGCDPRTALILGVLGLTREDFGRFQDSFPHDSKYVVLTRIAGDTNYKWVFEKILSHPLIDGWSEQGPDIAFHFHKPSAIEGYVLPDSFTEHFPTALEATGAAQYLENTKDRPMP